MAVIDWDIVEDALEDAKAITWDTCHKIYVLMDKEQITETKGYGYGEEPDSFFTCEEMSRSEMLETLKKWFEKSCALRFIQSVSTNHEDPNAGYENLIEQGATEYETCFICGESNGCEGECEDEDEDEDEEDED